MSDISVRVEALQPYWEAFWAGRVPMLWGEVPRDPAQPVAKPPLGITRRTNLHELADELLRWADANHFAGGAFPFYCIYLFDVYNLTAALMGGRVIEAGDSHHMEPFVDDLDAAELTLDLDGPVADYLRNAHDALQSRCGDRIMISACAISGQLDVLEAVRGSEHLLLDLYDNPRGVHHCLRQIDAAAAQLLDFQAELYDMAARGSVCRHGFYSRGRVGVPQCDFAYMIGPDHFKAFALPYLQREFARLDGVVYHLDGVGNLPNLEVLCAEPNLHTIQWVPGAGQGGDWTPLYEQADALGHGCMFGGTMERFETWYGRHKAPWQHWKIASNSVAEVEERVARVKASAGV